MFPVMSVTCQRSAAINDFQRFRHLGQLAALWAKLTGAYPYLEEFDCHAARAQEGRKYLGLQTIPVKQITGSVSRGRDFDRRFRPLKKHLRDRWVGAFLRSGNDSWPPISVNKVGNAYFVEDGHHRVSVANFFGMVSIQAEVWDYPSQPGQALTCQSPIRLVVKGRVNTSPAHG